MKEIKFYKLPNGKEPVKDWLLDLDKSLRVKIIRRIERIYDDNFGDYKQLDSNLYEPFPVTVAIPFPAFTVNEYLFLTY